MNDKLIKLGKVALFICCYIFFVGTLQGVGSMG